ncbi:MAG: hypothetical protein R2747_15240 [Pyrinomonadaceae bacterium]
MKTLSEKEALDRLSKLKKSFQQMIKARFEPKAKNCLTCETKGACCLDAHFVNVHITRLEAAAIGEVLSELPEEKQIEIRERIEKTVEKYDLKSSGDTFAQTFACPLFEKDAGCLVHEKGKPAPCIQHACYENREDLPPDHLQTETEKRIERLNQRTYGNAWNWLPLPVWLTKS